MLGISIFWPRTFLTPFSLLFLSIILIMVWMMWWSGLTIFLAYHWLTLLHYSLDTSRCWKWIWKILYPKKIRVLIWLICHDAIPTNVFRCWRHVASNPSCRRCGGPAEDILHCVRDCLKANQVWELFGFTFKVNFSIPISGVWIHNFRDDPLFLIILWWQWWAHNVMVLGGESWNIHSVISKICLMYALLLIWHSMLIDLCSFFVGHPFL